LAAVALGYESKTVSIIYNTYIWIGRHDRSRCDHMLPICKHSRAITRPCNDGLTFNRGRHAVDWFDICFLLTCYEKLTNARANTRMDGRNIYFDLKLQAHRHNNTQRHNIAWRTTWLAVAVLDLTCWWGGRGRGLCQQERGGGNWKYWRLKYKLRFCMFWT